MNNEEYIQKYRHEDVRSLALKKVPEGVDAMWCLRQIEGYQLSLKKLPQWAATQGLWYPPRISMEQCSSETTALYKRTIAERLGIRSLADITGGFGVDFSYMAKDLDTAIYIERQQVLCEAAMHNMPLLGLDNVRVLNADAQEAIDNLPPLDAIFADPARRDTAGRKTVAIEDCTPDICLLQDRLLQKARYLVIKLSPMLDITQALRTLHHVSEVHVVSVRGECKELLFVLSQATAEAPVFHCVNLDTADAPFAANAEEARQHAIADSPLLSGTLIFEPNASILKAGMQEAFAAHYGLSKLHPHSNLYVGALSATDLSTIPARAFVIDDVATFAKADIKRLLAGLTKANLTIRNFPSTVADLRRKLKLKEGGDVYLFATTIADGTHILLRCRKA